MATQELQSSFEYDKNIHKKLLKLLKKSMNVIMKGKKDPFVENDNKSDNCSIDCQNVFHETTNIASSFHGKSLGKFIEKKSQGLQTRNDSYEDEVTGTMITYGELLCVAKGDENGEGITALSDSKYPYYWRDTFQQNIESRPPDNYYDPERNVQSFAISLQDKLYKKIGLRVIDKYYRIQRNTRFVVSVTKNTRNSLT